MPRCYLVAVAEASALDQTSNNWSLFNLIEQVQVAVDSPQHLAGRVLPYEVHTYWEMAADEIGREFVARIVLVKNNERKESRELSIRPDKIRHRLRGRGVPFFFEGQSYVTVEWRFADGQDWHPTPFAWPLFVEVRPTTLPTAQRELGLAT